MSKMLQDQNGNVSSKRILALCGFTVAVVLAVVALIWDKNTETAKGLVDSFLIFSGGMAGVSVAEFFKRAQ